MTGKGSGCFYSRLRHARSNGGEYSPPRHVPVALASPVLKLPTRRTGRATGIILTIYHLATKARTKSEQYHLPEDMAGQPNADVATPDRVQVGT